MGKDILPIRIRFGIAQDDLGRWYVVTSVAGVESLSQSFATEAEVTEKMEALRDETLAGLRALDVEVRHDQVHEEFGRRLE